MGNACPFLVACLLLSLPANALFLAGQSEQGGDISILCEGQGAAFVSLPSGGLEALPLGPDSQARFSPAMPGPYTFQCGNETITIRVSLPGAAGQGAYSGAESTFIAAGAAIAFIAALCLAARFFQKPCTVFSKSESSGRVSLFLRAGEDLHGIRISDPQGGEDGAPLELSIPHLAAGQEWGWEYESNGGPLQGAALSAKCKKGEISLVSGATPGGARLQKGAGKNRGEARKLAKSNP
ncbi:MAG: hypothetical protein WC861_03295 [Candidatus Micrarchaeia archaeon]